MSLSQPQHLICKMGIIISTLPGCCKDNHYIIYVKCFKHWRHYISVGSTVISPETWINSTVSFKEYWSSERKLIQSLSLNAINEFPPATALDPAFHQGRDERRNWTAPEIFFLSGWDKPIYTLGRDILTLYESSIGTELLQVCNGILKM